MLNKHFLKVLMIFTGMIVLGLLGIFLISYYEKNQNDLVDTNNSVADVSGVAE